MSESIADRLAESLELLQEDVDGILTGRGTMDELRAKLRRLKSDLAGVQTEVIDLVFEEGSDDVSRTKSLPSTRAAVNGHNGKNGHTNGNGRIPLPEALPPASADVRTDDGGRYDPAVSLERIVASRTNPRKTFDQAKLAELADSIRAKGVLQPILVRPAKGWQVVAGRDGRKEGWFCENLIRKELLHFSATEAEAAAKVPLFELVAGERRYRAAKLAGLAAIPAVIRDLSDKDALEVQILENLQREDLDPIEEAQGFDRLLRDHGYTADSLAAKVHKEKTYVYAALKLLKIPERAAEALRAGEISVSVAQLIGRIPNDELRASAAGGICGENYEGRPLTYKEAKEWIEQDFMVELKGSPFDVKDKSLVPEAGSCKDCPKRVGNNRTLYPDGRADTCTDPACYRAKEAAHNKRALERAKESGKTVLEQTKGVFSSQTDAGGRHLLTFNSPYVEAHSRHYGIDAEKTWAELLGDQADLVVIAVDPAGHPHELIIKKFAEAALVKAGKMHPANVDRGCNSTKARAKELLEEKVQAEASHIVLERVQTQAELKAASALLAAKPDFLRPLTRALLGEFHSETLRRVEKRRKIEDLDQLVDELDARGCFGLLCELVAAVSPGFGRQVTDVQQPLLKALDIDRVETEKIARARAKLKVKEAGKGKEPAKASAGKRR